MSERCIYSYPFYPLDSHRVFFFYQNTSIFLFFKAKNMEDLNEIVRSPSRVKSNFDFIAQHVIFICLKLSAKVDLCILNNKQYFIERNTLERSSILVIILTDKNFPCVSFIL